MDTTNLLNALDEINAARETAYGLRAILVDVTEGRGRITGPELAAMAELAKAVGDRCAEAGRLIQQAQQ